MLGLVLAKWYSVEVTEEVVQVFCSLLIAQPMMLVGVEQTLRLQQR
jgi:hypothetical protein